MSDPADGSSSRTSSSSWRLAALNPVGEQTGCHLDALPEDFGELEPKGPVA
ncbi:hypothetical protein [Streptomyces sp. rh34]|uniref:hypothetical protein n=1 Tax=Streptomyces sp. rh34 TaxID=2034272 RepID=UPI0015CF1484|nr:hypothetical protein [Streptomyces sp. rh34]